MHSLHSHLNPIKARKLTKSIALARLIFAISHQMEAPQLPSALHQQLLDFLLIPISRNPSNKHLVRRVLHLCRDNTKLNCINDWHCPLQRWCSSRIILLAPPDSQWMRLKTDSIKLDESSSFLGCAELNEEIALVSIDLCFDHRISRFEASFGSLKCVS